MEVSACSSTDSKSDAAFYQLPRPLQVKWISIYEDPATFSKLTYDHQQSWIKFATLNLIDSSELCELCDYLEMKHDCQNLKQHKIDVMLATFIKYEDFDIDDGRHAILLIFQAIQEDFEVGYHCRRIISEEDNLSSLEDVEYNVYILRSFYSAFKNHFDDKIRYALVSQIAYLSQFVEEDEHPLETSTINVKVSDQETDEVCNTECDETMSDTILNHTENRTKDEHIESESGKTIDSSSLQNLVPSTSIKPQLLASIMAVALEIHLSWANRVAIDVWYTYQTYFKHKHVHITKRDRYTCCVIK